MNLQRIYESLDRLFDQHRLIFWYDPDQEWEQAFEGFGREDTQKIKMAGNEFGTKVAIHQNTNPHARYLLYFPSAKPKDAENWLLDLLLQGHEYKADRTSLTLQEVGLSYDYRPIIEEHVTFFESAKRLQAFQDLLTNDEDATSLRLKMMAILTKTAPDIDAILLSFLDKTATQTDADPVEHSFKTSNLIDAFWKEVGLAFAYVSDQPSLRDFVTALFRQANPLDTDISLNQHTHVFLQRWKDSQTYQQSYRQWANTLEKELHISSQLQNLNDLRPIETSDAFPAFEKYIIHHICQRFETESNANTLQETIDHRRQSFWFSEHQHGYEALGQALLFKDLMASVELTVDSMDLGIERYKASWHKIDMAYRRFYYHQRQYAQVTLMAPITQWVEKTYVNNYLLPLTDRWSDHVQSLSTWSCNTLKPQTNFFEGYVQPFLKKGQKIFVVISDALRFEAAAEFVTRLQSENRWTAELDAVLGCLPSYTQLGMASLLPGKVRSIQLPKGTVSIDGKSSAGTDNRNQILQTALEGKAVAIQADTFLDMNTKTEARPLMRNHDVIYIFHDTIDNNSHAAKNENKTIDTVEKAFEELMLILRKIANTNGSNMLLTADHGFLFQQSDIEATDDCPLPNAQEWHYRDRRFAIGQNITDDSSVKIFSAQQVGLDGDWSAAFPRSLGRFPLQGSGKRYVHGGISLQEVLIPVVQINKKRSDDTTRVEVEILQSPSKITTGQISLRLYQDRPIAEKILPRTLRIGVFAKDSTELSEIRTITFEATEEEPRHREQSLVLTLARAADAFNNQEVEIRLDEVLPGTTQKATYKTQLAKLQKPFESDFDDF